VVGADNTLDYLRVPAACAIVRALPNPKLGWVDASSVAAGEQAAPALAIQAAVGFPLFARDWDSAVVQPQMALSELLVVCSLAALERCAASDAPHAP